MSELWLEYWRRVNAWQAAGDSARLRLVDLYLQAALFQETNPEQSLAIFTQAKGEALHLMEPWWDLFFESQRLNALVSWLGDFTRALPQAIDLTVRFSTPEGLVHAHRLDVLQNVVCTFTAIDPFGYQDDIDRGFKYLDGQISPGPAGLRFVIDIRRISYLCVTDRWSEGHDLAMRTLGLIDQSHDWLDRIWHGSWTLYRLCRICKELGRADELAEHAQHMAELSKAYSHLRRAEADGWIWQAFTRRSKGDEREASHCFHQGMALLKDLESRHTICADPIAAYYEACGDFRSAVRVRDRELIEATRKGELHAACDVHVSRCKLLAKAGELTPADLAAAREAAGKLRYPARFLKKIDAIDSGSGSALDVQPL